MEKLSKTEEIVMHAIWHASEDISIQELIEVLRLNYDRDYARTTVITMLDRMEKKGFVHSYRKGKYAYVQPSIPLDDYAAEVIFNTRDLLFDGSTVEVLKTLMTDSITKDELEKIQKMLNQTQLRDGL